ncbi:AAA family ATPase [Microcoleus sp. AT8-B1]|uniref:AAA family ATPase n=1 Tax=unclassified Microcoleus TaxID=2642155 RepID=UPI002FD41A88
MVANFDQSTRKLLNSSKSNPCPVCGRIKDGDCRISHDGKMVLCHQNFDHAKTQQPDVWHFDGTSSDNRCGVYVFKEPTTKSIRPKQTRYWEYPARDGSRLVRVCREDDGEGKKKIWQERWDKDEKRWLPGLGKSEDTNKVDRASIPIYRYAEVREAIAKGEPVHTVEGEPCADIFWKLGLAATTNIGGGGKFTQSDAQDLQGAEVVVIVPDRDKKGIDHADKLAEYFPDALWLYPFPESKVWENLPKDHGLDIADWIEHHKITADDIKAVIGEKKAFKAPAPQAVTTTKLSMEEAAEQARQILRSERDELTTNIKLEKVRQKAGMGDYAWENKIIKPLKRDMDAERFKLELLALLQMSDPVERCRQIALLAPKYSMGAGTIKEAMAAMKQRTQAPTVQVLTLEELFDSESEAMDWLVSGLLPVGETVLLCALPKVGKSKLAIDLAFSVATGESRFLGQRTKQGRVLLITPDASSQSLKQELTKRGFRKQDTANLHVIPRWNIDQMAVLEAELENFRPDLVVIDSLKKITAGKEISENSAEFADNIIALNDMLSRYRAAGILVHHANKGNDAIGVERARGSTAIVGACWGTWMLDRIPKPDPNNKKKLIHDPKCPKRIFTATNRDSEGTTLNIEFNTENNSWDFISEVGMDEEEAAQQQTHRDRILNVLKANSQRQLSGPEIMELLGVTREQRGPIYSELGRMENKRLISSKPAPGDKRFNLYFLPNFEATETTDTVTVADKISLPPPPPTPTVSIANYSSEIHTVHGLENSQQNSQQIVSKNSECDSYKIAETPSAKSINPIVSHFPLSQGGEGVKCTSETETVTDVNVELSHPIQIALPPTAPTTPTTPTAQSVPPIAPLEPTAQSVPPIAPLEPTAQSVPPIAHLEPTAQSVPPIAHLEPTAQSVSPIAPPELVAEQKPERKTDDQVVAEKKRHQEFSIGDRVEITEIGNIHHGQKGKVTDIFYGSSEIDYQIKLDKVADNQEEITVAVPKVSHTPVLMQLKAEGEAQEPREPEPVQVTTPEPETITPADAEKLREIATVWWDEFYGEQLQNLLTQMFGWQAPGTKYDATTINAWLVTEDAIVRDRIGELWQLKHGEGLIDSLDCGF